MEELALKERNLFDSFDSSSDEAKRKERNLFDFLESSTDLMKPASEINGLGDNHKQDESALNDDLDGASHNEKEECFNHEQSDTENRHATDENVVGTQENSAAEKGKVDVTDNCTDEENGKTADEPREEGVVSEDASKMDPASEHCSKENGNRECTGSEAEVTRCNNEEKSESDNAKTQKDVATDTTIPEQMKTNKATCIHIEDDSIVDKEPSTEIKTDIKTTDLRTDSMAEGAVLDEIDGTFRMASSENLISKATADPSKPGDDVNKTAQPSAPNPSGSLRNTDIVRDVLEETKDTETSTRKEVESTEGSKNKGHNKTSEVVTDEELSNHGKEKKTKSIKMSTSMGQNISESDMDEESQSLVIDLTDTDNQHEDGNTELKLQSQSSQGFSPSIDENNESGKEQNTGASHPVARTDEKESSHSGSISNEEKRKVFNHALLPYSKSMDQTKDVEEIEKLLQEYCRSTNDGQVDVSDEGNIAVTFKMKPTEEKSETSSCTKGTDNKTDNKSDNKSESSDDISQKNKMKRKISTEESWSAVGQKRCPYCLFTTDQQGLLDAHMYLCGKKKDKKEEIKLKYKDGRFGCQNCLNAFTVKKKFEEHIAFHLLQEPYICLSCMVTFDSKKKIEAHVKEKHAVEMVKCGLRGSKKITNIIETLQSTGEYSFLGRQLSNKFSSLTRDDIGKKSSLSKSPTFDKTILSVPTVSSQPVAVTSSSVKSSTSSTTVTKASYRDSTSVSAGNSTSQSMLSSTSTFKPTKLTLKPISMTDYKSLLKPKSSIDKSKEASSSVTQGNSGLSLGVPASSISVPQGNCGPLHGIPTISSLTTQGSSGTMPTVSRSVTQANNGIPTVVHSAKSASVKNTGKVSIAPRPQLAVSSSTNQLIVGQNVVRNSQTTLVQTSSPASLRPLLTNQVQSPPVILVPTGNILVPVTMPKINLVGAPATVGSFAFTPGQRVTLQPAIPVTQSGVMNIPVTQPGAMNVPVTQPGVMNIPAPQILNTSTTPTSSMLIFSNSATTVTTGNFPTILQSNITNITSIQPKNNTGKGIQSSITPAACSTSTISSSASMNGSSKSADVTSRSGSTSSTSNLTDTSQASSDSEKNNIKSSATSNPTTSEGQVKQEKSNKKLFFKKSGTGYNCKLCKFEVKDEDSFAIHVWNHFHVDQKICKTCQEKTDDHKSCKLVTQVMDGLHSAAEIAAKERKQKVQRNENEQASVNATNNNPSPDEVIILDEETSEEGEKKQSNQDAEGGAETEESSGVSSIKILSTYSLSTSGLNSKRNEPVLEKDERVPPNTGNEQEEAKGNNTDTGILQPFQNVIDRVVENSVIEQQTNSNVTPEAEKTKQKDEAEKTKQKDEAEKTKQKDEENIASTSKHTELTADVQTVSNADASVRKEPLLPVNPLTYFYQCGFQDCGFAAYTSNTYRDHLITVHPKSSQYNCIHCGHKSVTDESHMRHIIGHSKYASSVLFVCGEGCKFGTNLLSAFKEHVLKIHPNLLDYKCASCKEIFQNIEDLIRHLELNKLQFVLCPHCTFKDRNRRTVMKHLSEVHPGKPRQITVTSQLVCLERCLNNYTPPTVTPTLFVRKEDEKAEKVELTEVKSKGTVESSDTKGNIEDIAKERVRNDDIEPSIETEERNTTGDIPSSKCTTDNSYFQCTHCTYLTQSRGQLGNHILNHSRPRSTRAFACFECSSGNDNLPQFSSHMKHHEGEFKVKVYMCFHCPFQTNQRDKMVTHGLKKHSSGVPDVDFSVRTHRYRQQAFHCKNCEYIHKDEKVFNDHVQNCRGSDGSKMSRVMSYPTKETDTIDNPTRTSDTMDNPNRASDTMDNPTKASDTEDEEQPPRPHISKKFSCSQCRRGFERVAQLKQHMNIHLMKENFIDLFKCGYCPFLSTYEHLVPKHIQEKHPKYKISVKQKREYLNTTVSNDENTSFESSNDIDLLHCDCCSFSCNDVQELAQHTAVHLSGARAETKSVEPTKVKKPYEGPKKKFHIPFGNIFKENVHCTECSFKTKRRLELLRHIKSHENLDPVSQFAERKENSASDHNKRPFLKIKFGKRKSSDNLTSSSKKRRLSDSPSDVSDNDEWEPPLSPVSKKKQVAVKSTTQSPKSNSLPSFYYLGGDVLDLKLRPCYSKDEEEPMYECLFCKDVFEEKYTLHRHLLQHMNVSFFKCSYCDHGDLETSTLVTHIQKEHHKPIKHEQIDQKEIESRINKVIHDMKAEEYWGPSENENLKPEKEGLKQEMQSSYEDEKSCSYNDGGDENDSFQTISNANIKQEPLDPEAEIQSTHSSCASENSFYPSDGKSPRLGPLPPCVVMMGRFFKCTICNYRLDNRSKIVLHASKHSSRKRNMCSACTYRSHYKGDVNKHVKMVHQGAAQLVYDFEDIEVDSQFLLLDEIRRQNLENNDNGPNFTPKPEKIKVSLDDSNSKGNSVRKYLCPYCEYRSNWTGDMKRHIERHHPGQEYEVIRDAETYVKRPIKNFSLKLAKTVQPKPSNPTPDTCTIDSRKKVQTVIGMRSYYKCLLCNQTFKSRRKIFFHLRTTKCKRNLWRCSVCKKFKCDKERIVQEHIKESHPTNNDAKASLCNQKGKIRIHKVPKSVFRTSSNDENGSDEPPAKVPKISDSKSKNDQPSGAHVKFVGDRWVCTKCNYRSASKANVVRHVVSHSDVKKFKCPICEYRGRLETTVKKHMAVCHPGEDKDVIRLPSDHDLLHVRKTDNDLVPVSRTVEEAVKEEAKVDENSEKVDAFQKFYKCLVCGILLNSISGLYKHLRKKCTTAMYGCSECNLKSLYENSIKRHIKKQHPKATCNVLPIRSKMKVVKVSKNIDIEEPSKEENGGNDSTKLTSLKLKIETVPTSGKHIDQKPDVNSDLKACPACKFPVNSCKALRIHVHTVHPNHRLLCLYCKEYVTKKVKQLVTHNRLFHGKDGFSDLNFDIIPESEVRSKNLDRRPIFLYKCGLCDHKAQRQPMKFHIFLHFQYNPFKCKYCDMRFKSIKVLQHTRVRHPDKKLEYDYEKDEKLEKEITNMLNNGRYQTISQSSYKMNESGIKGAKENSVEKELDEKEETEDDLDDVNPEEKGVENENDDSISRGDPNHMFSPCHNYTVDYDMKTGKSIYQCSICPYNTTVIKTITNHFYHHVPHVFKCPYCSYQNYPRSKVVCHLKYKHPKKTVHVVDLRNKMKDLKFREYEMEVEKPVKSPKPRRSEHGKPPRKKPKGLEKFEDIFTSEESDDDNQSSKTDGSRNGRLIYCCNYCTKELESLYHYRQHLATHGGFVHQVPGSQIESRLKCGYCSYLAADDNDFKRHMEGHFNARPYSCPYCSFSQYRPSAIKNHINSSHPGKPIDVIKDQRSSCLIEENMPSRQVMLVEMDPKVRLNDILAMDAADFENLLTKHGVSVIDLNFILDEKFERVSKTLGLHEDVVEEKDDGLSDISEDENLGETENEVTETDEREISKDETENDELETENEGKDETENDEKEPKGDDETKIDEGSGYNSTADTNVEQMETDNEFESLELGVENIESPSDSGNLDLKYEDVSEEENEDDIPRDEPTYEDISDNDEI